MFLHPPTSTPISTFFHFSFWPSCGSLCCHRDVSKYLKESMTKQTFFKNLFVYFGDKMFVFGHVKVRKLYFAKLHTVKKNE